MNKLNAFLDEPNDKKLENLSQSDEDNNLPKKAAKKPQKKKKKQQFSDDEDDLLRSAESNSSDNGSDTDAFSDKEEVLAPLTKESNTKRQSTSTVIQMGKDYRIDLSMSSDIDQIIEREKTATFGQIKNMHQLYNLRINQNYYKEVILKA